jgi:hypothetical protein
VRQIGKSLTRELLKLSDRMVHNEVPLILRRAAIAYNV